MHAIFFKSFQGSQKHSRFEKGAETDSTNLHLRVQKSASMGAESADLEKQCATKQITNKRKEIAALF